MRKSAEPRNLKLELRIWSLNSTLSFGDKSWSACYRILSVFKKLASSLQLINIKGKKINKKNKKLASLICSHHTYIFLPR